MDIFSRPESPRHTPAAGWTPGAGWDRARQVFGDRLPDITEADERRVDDMIAQARRAQSHPVHDQTTRTP